MYLLKRLNIIALITVTLFFFSCAMPSNQADSQASDSGQLLSLDGEGETLKAVSSNFEGRGAGIVQAAGRLQVYGNKVCAENGDTISLAGMSFFWSNWAGDYYTADVVNYLVDNFKVSLVRAAYGVPHEGSPDGDWSKIERVVDAAIARDIYVIIDWHTEGDAWNHHGDAQAFFQHFSSKYGNNPHVIYEVWNEPIDSGVNSLRDWAQDMAGVIRANDPDNLIICGSDTWSQYPNSYTINDPNAAYTFHGYFDDPANGEVHRSQFYKNVDDAMNKGSAVFVTEFGSHYGTNWGTNEIMDACIERGISMAAWSVNHKVEPWSIFNGFMGGLTEIGSFYQSRMTSWPPYKAGPVDPHTVPGKIEAEAYASQSGVQTESCDEGGQNVGYIDAGDSMTYRVNVTEGGSYKAEYRVAGWENGALQLKSGSTVLDSVAIPNTGAYQNWDNASSGNTFVLTEGEQDLVIASTGSGWNINHFTLTKVVDPDKRTLTLSPASETSGAGTYGLNDVVTISYTGSGEFLNWSGDTATVANVESAVTTVVMNTNISLTANVAGGPDDFISVEAENYLTMSGVQTEPCDEGGQNVGWIDSGDWMEYQVDAVGGSYIVDYRVAGWDSSARLVFQVNGQAQGFAAVPNTGAYQAWSTVGNSQNVNLDAGLNTIRIFSTGKGWNINYFTLELENGPAKYTLSLGPDTTGAGTYDANDVVTISYTGSGEFESWTGNTATVANVNSPTTTVVMTGNISLSAQLKSEEIKVEAENFAGMSGIKLEDCGEDSTQNIGWIDAGDWVEYQVNVPASTDGKYSVTYRAASNMNGGVIEFKVNGSVKGTTSIGSTGGWQSYQDKKVTVSLNAGLQTIQLYAPSGPWNLNYFTIKAGGSGPDGDTPVDYYGEMVVRGNRINGSKTGAPMQVKGMSFFWSNWSDQFYNAGVVDRMVDEFKCEIVRAAYGVDDGGNVHGGSYEAQVEKVVDQAINRGIYVIIDWHSHGANYNPGAAQAFFSKMAAKYGQYDNVIFEVFNEPIGQSWWDIKSYAEGVINVIRQHSDNLVIVGTSTWSQDVDHVIGNAINDPNVAYTLHFYAGTHKADLRAKADAALNAGLALMVTEWGTCAANGDGGIDYGSTAEWLAWMDANKLSWANWAVNDKGETSSIFYGGGAGLTEAGNYLKDILTSSANNAPWR